ncbi:unnamed protein product [Phyllotreta striolata]|uniref:Uncharacterized protein n=1 Tax=Phyllotreta striolata TaxID=444603 RepID=A0A9P0GNY6_PHYSR|nr:unnamed protein product [Phyllotreta striolata]
MAFKLIALCSLMVCANAGLIAAPAGYAAAPAIAYSSPALTSQSANIYRSYGNLGQISTYSKTIDTPFSSVSKSDVRVSNPGIHLAQPVEHHSLVGVAYSAAPAVSHISFDSGLVHYAF